MEKLKRGENDKIIIERVNVIMKKSRGVGIVLGLMMISIIIIGGVHKKVFNRLENSGVIEESTNNKTESAKEMTQNNEYENKEDQSKASLRNYDFEVKEADYHQDENESNYLEVRLMITNHDPEDQVMALNSISLIIQDSVGKEIERFELDNVNDVDAQKVGIDYFHHTIPAREASEVKLFYLIEDDVLQQGNKVALHFNPFGTEGAVIHGKNEKGEMVEIMDTNNVADIYLNLWLERNE